MSLSNTSQSEALADELLLVKAQNRIKRCDIANDISHKDLLKELGISTANLKDSDVEIK